MTLPAFTPLAASLPDSVPFVGPETLVRQRGKSFVARIGANESGFGPSPRVKAAMAGAIDGIWQYGDPENFELKTALAAQLGTPFDTLTAGEGVDGLLGLAARLFIQPGTKVVTSLGAYPTFNFHVVGFGGTLVSVPYEKDRENLDALLAAVRRENAAIVYLANPDNPMGTWWPEEDVRAFAAALPATTLFILDEAYGETAPEGTLPAMGSLGPNVLRFRTFSKAYGLAGARVGYAIGAPALIKAFDRVRNHFGLNRLGQVAAIAALGDQDYLRSVVADIAASREAISEAARVNGLLPIPSATNFVAVDCGADGVFAKAVLDGLIARDIFVRKPMAPVLDRCIRVSAGRPPEMAAFAEALADTLKALRG